MATLGVTFTGAALSLGGKKAEDPTTPPINAKSSEEESFVKEYVKKAADKVQGKQ
jgi:F-type H+-transporting ATPase subunit k